MTGYCTVPTFGWIMQPAMFDTPAGYDPRGSALAKLLIRANEQHIQLAQSVGIGTIWVEDHMGWADKAHLECFTNLSWLAGRHPGLRWGTMVCGQAFRNPAYLAKLAANLHLLTEGQFILGIGAGNNPGEHREYGYPFPPPGERLDCTEEAIQIIRALWSANPATFTGIHYQIEGAFCSPLPEQPIPLMIGGGGEQRTLRLVAQYGDWWCADVSDLSTFTRKNQILDQHCTAVGREPQAITRAMSTWISVEDDSAQAVRWPDLHIVAGTPAEVTAELQSFMAAGVQHFAMRFMDYPATDGFNRFVQQVLPQLLSN